MTTPGGALVDSARAYDLLIALLTLGRERVMRERLLAPAQLRPGESVLDVGCGTGGLAIVAARQVGASGAVAGIDPSPAMVQRAATKAARAGVSVRFEVAYAQAPPFGDATCDVILSTLMLHHIPRAAREDSLLAAHRVLKPGGRLLLVDFGPDASGRRGLIGHLHRHLGFSARKLAELATNAGFEVADSGSIGTWDLQFVVGRRCLSP